VIAEIVPHVDDDQLWVAERGSELVRPDQQI
jgi:hypothetical protein